jgi:plasmid stabilization system protein ParE
MTFPVFSAQAEDDLFAVWQNLAERSGAEFADCIQRDLLVACGKVGQRPGIGHRRQDLTNRDVFFYRLYQYMIVYRKSAPIEITAIVHGKRDLGRILDER